MKKLLIFAVVFAIIACPLFAAAATKAAEPAAPATSKITTVTKSMSEANYPGVLVPGSLTGTDVFVSDISLLGNTTLFEYVGTPMGLIVLKTDIGTIGAAIAPEDVDGLNNIHMYVPEDILTLLYGTKIGAMPVGAAVQYSLEKEDYTNLNLSGFTPPGNVDFRNEFDQYLAVKAGAGIDKGLDVGASVMLLNNFRKLSRFAGINWTQDNVYETSTLQVNLSGRLALGNDITTSATLSYLGSEDNARYYDDDDDYTDRWNNSTLTLSAVIGKNIRITDTFIVKIAAGLDVGGYTYGVYQYIDNIRQANSWLGNIFDGDGDRTQYGYWDIPLNVAVEAKLNDTWTLNSGVEALIVGFDNTHSMANSSALIGREKIVEYFDSTLVEITPGLDYAIGLTGKIGDLNIDMQLNPMIILNGPYFISGNSIGGLNYSVALHYDWN